MPGQKKDVFALDVPGIHVFISSLKARKTWMAGT
jgi:hypothetical protein